MDPFTLRLPWGPILRLFSRNPLVRRVDRVEAMLMLGAVVVAFLAAPFAAAAVGSAVHDAGGHLTPEQAQTQRADTAPTVQIGDRVGIWVDADTQQVDEPAALSRAANEAVMATLVTWASFVAAAAGLLVVGRVMLNRVRNTGWQHDIDNLLCRGGGQTNTQP